MPVKIELQGHGAGGGVLQVSGNIELPESLSLAIQRNDGLYLGDALVWQPSPHWHPQFSVTPTADGLTVALGTDIIDGIIDAGGVPLRLTLRLDDNQQSGVLRIRGELIGSGAAAPASPETADIQLPHEPVIDLAAPDPEPAPDPAPTPTPEPAKTPTRKRSSKLPWLLLLLLLAGGLAASWYFGLLNPLLAGPTTSSSDPTAAPDGEQTDDRIEPDTDQQQPLEPPTEPPTAPPQEPALEPPPQASPPTQAALTGLAFVRGYLAGNPTPAAIFDRGSEAEQAGDCDAALVLFNTAANRDPTQAGRLAQRYDPDGFSAAACIDQPDAPYAIIYYTDAANAGTVDAQRRLGQLLTARESRGPTFEEGMDWLRRAADAGDQQARASLQQLEQEQQP